MVVNNDGLKSQVIDSLTSPLTLFTLTYFSLSADLLFTLSCYPPSPYFTLSPAAVPSSSP